MSNIERLKELADLHEKGLITREQFDRERDLLLGAQAGVSGEVIQEAIGAYRVLGMIGRGGMGTVYRARHRSEEVARRQGGDVAIKAMHPHLAANKRFQERFEREASMGLKLDHPGIVGVYDLVVDGGTLALVMELAEGRTLKDLVGRQTGPLPWDRARPMFEQVLAAVGAAHKAGVIHRDLKPENVLVGSDGRLRVADFGIAKEIGSERTRTGTGMGTAGYMAPEQYRDASKVDARADVYALGMTLYEMLAGRLPWDPDTSEFEVLQCKARGDLPPPTQYYPDIPPHVVAAVMRAISVEPDGRPADIDAFAALLAQPGFGGQREPERPAPPTPSAQSGPSGPRPFPASGTDTNVPGKGEPPGRGSRGPLYLALGLGCLLLCGFGVAVVLLLVLIGRDAAPTTTLGGPVAALPVPAAPGFPFPADSDPIAASIRAIPHPGGSSEWDSAAKSIVLAAYDADRSGAVANGAEVQAISCATWHALDDRVKEQWESGLRTVYGFEQGYSWLGYLVGIDESIRPVADAFLSACQSSGWTSQAAAGAQPGLAASVPGGTAPSDGSVASRIRRLPQEGGSSDWDAAVKPIMLGAFDGNGSGAIETAAESGAVTCDVWRALDDGVRTKWSYGLRVIYGFNGNAWLGYLVGFDESIRQTSDAHATACGLGTETTGAAVVPSPSPAAPADAVAASIRSRPEEGGSSEWDAQVKPILVAAYDLNGSGSIDNAAEVAAVPCATWKALDDGVKVKWDYGLRTIYGFQEGYSWVGYAVGFSESVRVQADAAAAGCGL